MKKVDTIEKGREERLGRAVPARRVRRTHSIGFKAQVVQACEVPGASVAGVALAHGVNANLVRKWITRKNFGMAPSGVGGLLPVHVLAEALPKSVAQRCGNHSSRGHSIEVELAGAIVRVRSDFDIDALRDVVRVLRDTLMR